jgi:hypothetical protein
MWLRSCRSRPVFTGFPSSGVKFKCQPFTYPIDDDGPPTLNFRRNQGIVVFVALGKYVATETRFSISVRCFQSDTLGVEDFIGNSLTL